MNAFLLYLLARDIAPKIAGRRIAAVRRLDPLLAVELTGRKPARLYLTVYLATPGPFLWLGEKDPLPGVGAAAMRRLDGSRVLKAIDPPRNRILRLPLESAEGGDRELALYLYGSSAKVRIEAGGTIVESLNPDEAGTPAPHTFGRRVPFFGDADEATLETALGSGERPDRAVLGMELELAAAFAGDIGGLVTFRDAMLGGPTPFALAGTGRLGAAVPLPPGAGEARFGPFTAVETACAAVGDALLVEAREQILSHAAAPLRRRLQARERLLEKLRGEAEAAGRFERLRAEADILAAYQSQVPPGASSVELPDLYDEGKTRRITLDPALSVREQVQKRYKRAGKMERSREALAARIAEVEAEVEALRNATAQSEADLATALGAVEKAAKRFGLRRQRKAAERAPVEKQHRRFDLGSGWFVLVGRGDKENDEITFRIARPDDIWMHAQQTPGSHVVLKCLGKPGNPPDSILETTASIAAHFSKAKHSKLVPVIYTRRKYVRKFRGAKPGEVICEREKTIFAEPRLPE